ncbi:MAG: diaminopimelate epimerase [Chloroflexi bacterium]|nr:diaminopimelate epimerase [Chloroflexota bacterium]
MKFTKMHGAGNDYLYIDARSQSRDWPALSMAMSDRHTGVGSDGIILMLSSDRADLRMRMFNADGSEGEMCGNGIRCLVRFALDRGIAPPDKTPVSVETLAGVLEVTPIWENGVMSRARVGMGKPILRPEEIPVDLPGQELVMDHPLRVDGHSFDLTFVSMGNPHAVAFIDEPVDDVRLADIGPLVERHALFPQRVNFEICNVLEGSRIKTRVWERGSGITMACGTGACAVAVAARLHGYIGDESTIELPGGELKISWPGEGEVVMEGPVAQVFEGEWPD